MRSLLILIKLLCGTASEFWEENYRLQSHTQRCFVFFLFFFFFPQNNKKTWCSEWQEEKEKTGLQNLACSCYIDCKTCVWYGWYNFYFSVVIMCQEKRSGEKNLPVSQDWQEQRIRWKCPMEPRKLITSGENKFGWVPADPLPSLSGIWGKILVLKPNSVPGEYGQNVAFRCLEDFLQQLVEH